MKALVAVSVSREWVETEFLMQMGTWQIPTAWQVKFGWFKQFTAQERHNVAAREVQFNYDKLIFMDTDQIYPPDYLMRMLKHEEPVVSALNVSRYHPFEFTCYNITGEMENYGIKIPTYEAVEPPPDKPTFECDMAGTGAMMIDAKVFTKLPQPFFKDICNEEGAVRILPDDFYFGWLLYKAGIKITVDRTIMVGHISKITVSPYNMVEIKRAWEKVNSGWGITKDGKHA